MEFRRCEGLVVRVTGKAVWVDTGGKVVPCLLRGRFRSRRGGFQIVAGDRVEVSPHDSEGGTTAIEKILPRRSRLSRRAGARGGEERVIVANVDTLFVVESLREPEVSRTFVDRVLVSAETGGVAVHICLNKVDLESADGEASGVAAVYEGLGYAVTRTSAVTGEGIEDIASRLHGGIYAIVGRSGVGKTSILNRIAPDLNLRVREVAEKTGRGKHTTTSSQLFPISGGYVADTPGMQTFGFPGSDAQGLSRCFPELRSLEGECRFHPCTHTHEPECAVKAALDEGRIARSRYESYTGMLAEIELRVRKRYS